MLKDPKFCKAGKKLHEGIFLSSFPFNYNHTLDPSPSYEQEYPKLYNIYPKFDLGSYGVCDGFKQLLEKYEPLVIDPNRDYTFGLTKVVKAHQESWGGWRWHKWGEYIGDQEPTCEYLYDEPIIDEVFTYSIILIEDRNES